MTFTRSFLQVTVEDVEQARLHSPGQAASVEGVLYCG